MKSIHRQKWYEKNANRKAAKYFSKYGVDWENDKFYYFKHKEFYFIQEIYPL